jgi:4'-phosphopantetheinyl transferase
MERVSTIEEMPLLMDDEIHVWGAKVSELSDRLGDWSALLSEAERARAGRFRREEDCAMSMVARGSLRLLLAAYTGRDPAGLVLQAEAHGKPFLEGDDSVAFNVSHSGEWVVLAFAKRCRLGVDIERLRSDRDMTGIAERFFSPEEMELVARSGDPQRTFFQVWVRKEALVKAHGQGLSFGLSRFSVPIADGRLPEKGRWNEWSFYGLEAGSRYASAVVTDRSMERVRCFDVGGLQWGL